MLPQRSLSRHSDSDLTSADPEIRKILDVLTEYDDDAASGGGMGHPE